MPRLSPALIHHARYINPHLARLLPACRDLAPAKLELRWLQEHSFRVAKSWSGPACKRAARQKQLLGRLVRTRASGKPLQYVIGTEFFGDLEIQCRKNVLIPRQETADWLTHLAQRILRSRGKIKHFPSQLKLLDLCTGTGCIPLLFQHIISQEGDAHDTIIPEVRSLGIDVSEAAVRLAWDNLGLYVKHHTSNTTPATSRSLLQAQSPLSRMNFRQFDIFSAAFTSQISHTGILPVDILLSNPPYISPYAFDHQTGRSVRNFEPKLALVPSSSSSSLSSTAKSVISEYDSLGDTFYPRLLELSREVCAKIIAFEVSDVSQALRVAKLAEQQGLWEGIEVWRDIIDGSGDGASLVEYRENIPIRGSGNGRAVICWRDNGGRWLGC